MSPGPRDGGGTDAERDAWLREALRHAPDAGASAPPGVRDAILRQARQATAGAAPRGRGTRPGPWASWWSRLMQPSVAAGFASVMVATLVGVMWWGQPIDEPLREANLPDASTRAAAHPATHATPAAPAEPATPAMPTAPVTPAAPAAATAPVSPVTPAEPAAAAEATSPTSAVAVPPSPPPRAQASAQPVPPPSATRPAAPSPDNRALRTEERAAEKERRSARAMADDSTRREALASDSARVSPVPQAPAPATATATATLPTLPAAAGATAAAPADRRRDDESADRTRSASRAAAAPAESATDAATHTTGNTSDNLPLAKSAPAPVPAQTGAARAQAPTRDTAAGAAPGAAGANLSRAPRPASEQVASPAPTANPLSNLRSTVAGAPGAWSWQLDGGAEQPMNDAVQAWLGRLDDATRSGWQAGPATAGSARQTLRLLRNGRSHTTLHVEADTVRLESAAQASVPRAPLPAATVEALAAALEQAIR